MEREPALGVMLVLVFTLAAMIVLSGIRLYWVGSLLAIAAAAVYAVGKLHLLRGYQLTRLTSFLHPGNDLAWRGLQRAAGEDRRRLRRGVRPGPVPRHVHRRDKIAFICAREYAGPDSLGPRLKAAFGGAYIANEKFTYETAEQAVEGGQVDAVAFGKLFIANPDLPQRFALQAPLNEPKVPEFYAGGAHGYTDYPSLSAIHSSDLNSSQARVNARVSSGS